MSWGTCLLGQVVRGKQVATQNAADLLAPRLSLGVLARGDGVTEAGDLDGPGPRALCRGEAREDRAQIHGYRESATAPRLVSGAELGALTRWRLLLYRAIAALMCGLEHYC